MSQESPAADTARMVRSASVLTVHCNTWGLWYASRQELLDRGVMMNPGRTTLSSLWASLLGELPHTPKMADPASLSLAQKLFAEPGAEDFLPDHPLMVRMQQVRRAMSFLETRDADLSAKRWPRPQATLLRLVRRLQDLLRREGSYAPASSLELIIDHMQKHPGFSFGFLRRYGIIRFVESDYFSPRELHLLRLLCLRHPDTDFVFEIYSNAVGAVFEHDYNLSTSLENKIGLAGEQGCSNMHVTHIEPETTTAFSSLVGQHPKALEAIDGRGDIHPLTDRPRLQAYETGDTEAALHELHNSLLDPAKQASTVVAVCGGDDNAEVASRLCGFRAVSTIASRTIDSTAVYAKLRLPFDMLEDASGDVTLLAALACDSLPPGGADAVTLRRWLHPWLSDLSRRGLRLKDMLEASDVTPKEVPREVADALCAAVELLRRLRDTRGDDLATAVYEHWQRVSSALLKRLSHAAAATEPWLDRMCETAAALTLGRQISVSCFEQGDACCFDEVVCMIRHWGEQRLVRVLEAGNDALLVSAADAPVAPGRSRAVFFGADAHRWPGFGVRHPLGDVSASMDSPGPMAPGADPLSVALQRLSQWGAEAENITLLATMPVSSNDDIPPATPLVESMEAWTACAPDNAERKKRGKHKPHILTGPDIFAPGIMADSCLETRFARLMARNAFGERFGQRSYPLQEIPQVDEAAQAMLGMLSPRAAALTNAALGEGLELLSPSRLNRFYQCPWAFLVSDVLKIVPPEEPQLGLPTTEEGSMVHGAVARIYRDLLQRYGGPVWLPELARREDLMALADRHSSAEVRAKRKGGVDIGEPLARRIAAIVRRVVNFDLQQQQKELCRVSRVEVKVRYKPPGTDFSLHGIIDRVEVFPQSSAVRLVDIKVSARAVNDHLSVPSPDRPANFQMPLYVMMAAGSEDRIVPGNTVYLWPGLLAALTPELKDAPNRSAPKDMFAACNPGQPAPVWMQELTDQICELQRQMKHGVYPPWPVQKACEYCPLGPACRCK